MVGGVDNLEKDSKGTTFGNVISLSKMETGERRRFRFIEYVGMTRRVFYPYYEEDEQGDPVVKYAVIMRPPLNQRTLLDTLIKADKRAFRRMFPKADPKTFKSQFSHTQKYMFLAFDRDEKEPIVHRIEVPMSVYDFISEKYKEVSMEDKSKLRHGPFWFWDVVVTATEKKNLGDNVPSYFKRRYSCEVYKNEFADTIRIAATDTDSDYYKRMASPEFLLEKGVFTAEEIKAMQEFDSENNVAAEIAPMSPEDIETLIKEEKPPYLSATRQGKPIFDYPKLLAEEFLKLEIQFHLTNAEIGELPAPPGMDDFDDEGDEGGLEEPPELDPAKEIKPSTSKPKKKEGF